jgi:hypothetical protein
MCPPVTMNNVQIPTDTETKYLGLHLDQRLTWKKDIKTKRKQVDMKYCQMYWLLNRKSKLSITNKIILYKVILKPISSYGLQIWGSAKPSTINLIQTFQSKTLRTIADAPWFESNLTLRNNLKIPFVKNEILIMVERYKDHSANHVNELIEELYTNGSVISRLNSTWPQDITKQ